MGSDQQFCLQWHNYQTSLLASLPQLLDSDDLTDVTLSAGGRNIKAHRVILSACSQYFKDLFKVMSPMQHPVIVLPGTNFTDLCALVTFMYSGEVNIYQDQLQGILSMADAMQIRGLAEVNDAAQNDTQTKKDAQNPSKRPRLLSHQNLGIPTVNPMEIDTASKRSILTESRDLTGHLMANFNFENYCDNQTMFSLQKNTQEEINLGNGSKSDIPKVKGGSENLNLYVNISRNEKARKSVVLPEPDVMHYMENTAYQSALSNPPNSSSLGISQEIRVKMDTDNQEFGCPTTESYVTGPSLPTNGALGDGQKHSNVDCENGQDQHSPCSDDSVGSNFGMENKVDRIQLGQNHPVTSQKYSTSLSKLCPSAHSSKLFATCVVCGKQLSNQYNLRVHMETHQNVNYACRVCNHVSRSRDALRKHISYRHPKDSKERLSVGSISTSTNGIMGTSRRAKIFSANDVKQ